MSNETSAGTHSPGITLGLTATHEGPTLLWHLEAEFPDAPDVKALSMDVPVPMPPLSWWVGVDEDGEARSPMQRDDGSPTPYTAVAQWRIRDGEVSIARAGVETTPDGPPVDAHAVASLARALPAWSVEVATQALLGVMAARQQGYLSFGAGDFHIEYRDGVVTYRLGERTTVGTGRIRRVTDGEGASLIRTELQRRRRLDLSDSDYKLVAETYKKAQAEGKPVRKAVQELFSGDEIPHSPATAARWIAEARRREYLPERAAGRPTKARP